MQRPVPQESAGGNCDNVYIEATRRRVRCSSHGSPQDDNLQKESPDLTIAVML